MRWKRLLPVGLRPAPGGGHRLPGNTNLHLLLLGGWLAMAMIVAACEPQPGSPTVPAGPTALPPGPTPTQPAPSPTPRPTETPVAPTEGGVIGAQVGPEQVEMVCAGLQRNGVAATALWLRWGDVDPGNGRYTWDELDRQVEGLRACGLEVALHVQARRHGELSALPPDLEEYARFLAALATHLKGRVRRYSLENEAVSPASWGDSADDYFRLLDAAYPAIKAADPEAIVLDSGLSSAALGIARAHDLYQAGQRTQALHLVQQTLAESAGGLAWHIPQSEEDLDLLFQDPVAARAVAWLPLLIRHQGSYDALQFHYYGPASPLPDLLRWLRQQGLNKPLEGWEVGRRYQGQVAFDEAAHAQETARLLVTAAGEGSRFSLFVRFLEWPQKGLPGLATRQGPRPAAVAFRVVAHSLNGFLAAERLDLGTGVWAYRFTRPQGDLYVLWTDGGQASVSLPLTEGAVNVTDIEGQTATADPSQLEIGPSPVLVSP